MVKTATSALVARTRAVTNSPARSGGAATTQETPGRASRRAGDAPLPSQQRLARALAEIIGPQRFRRTFGEAPRFEVSGDVITAPAPSPEDARWIARRFAEPIREAARRELGLVDVRVVVLPAAGAGVSDSPPRAGRVEGRAPGDCEAVGAPGADAMPSPASAPAPAIAPVVVPPPPARPARDPGTGSPAPGRERLRRLEDLVVGAANTMAFRAVERLLEPACPPGFSPLFIHGECGVGKTHLLQGLAARYRELNPGSKVRYTTGEAFTNGYITAIKEGKVDAFRAAHRALDLLCIDDVHFLSNKTATQSEFLHTFNVIGAGGRRIALASDEHPSRVRQFSRELVSRFVSGMVVRLDRPDQAMRVEIARQLGARRGLALDDAAAQLVASRCVESVREIEGALSRVEAFRMILPGAGDGPAVGATLVRQALGGDASARPLRPLRVEAIAHSVCEALRVEMAELVGRGRHPRVVLARAVITCLSRRLTTCSFPEIARALGRPNHSTVVTAHQRILGQIERSESCGLGPEFGEEHARMTVGELVERLARRVARPAEAA